MQAIVLSATYEVLDQVMSLPAFRPTRGAFTDLPDGEQGIVQATVATSLLPQLAALGCYIEVVQDGADWAAQTGSPAAPSPPLTLDLAYL